MLYVKRTMKERATSKRVESVDITFENLAYVNIPVKYFGKFYIAGIRTTVERLALNAIVQRKRADWYGTSAMQVRHRSCKPLCGGTRRLSHCFSWLAKVNHRLRS